MVKPVSYDCDCRENSLLSCNCLLGNKRPLIGRYRLNIEAYQIFAGRIKVVSEILCPEPEVIGLLIRIDVLGLNHLLVPDGSAIATLTPLMSTFKLSIWENTLNVTLPA